MDGASTYQNVAVTIDVLANDTPGSGPGPLRVIAVGPPLVGAASTNTVGQIVYTPVSGFLGEDTFAYVVSDGLGTSVGLVKVKVVFSYGLVWFPFNQTAGLLTEDAGGAFTGVLSGFSGTTSQWVSGKWNQAIDFNGTSAFVSISNFPGVLGASNRTCAVWVRTTSGGPLPVIAWGSEVAGNKWAFLLQDGHVLIEVSSGYLEGRRVVNDGQWHHVAVSFANDGTPDIL